MVKPRICPKKRTHTWLISAWKGIRVTKMKIFQTLKNYKSSYLPKDILAGIIIAAVSIPISMGYAEVSGLPPVYGLYGSVLPILFFAMFTTSPQFIF